MLLWVVAITTLCAMLWLAHYLRRVPDSTCPRCGEPLVRVEASVDDGDDPPTAWLVRRWTVPARCQACGWDGRMRRGPSPEAVRVRRSERGEAER